MIRPGDWDARPPLAHDEGALQPAAVRRRARRPAGARQGVLLRQLRAAPRAQRGGADLAGGHRSRWSRRRPTSTRASSASTPASPRSRRSAVRYNMVRWHKDNESGGLNLPGTGFIWDNNVDTIHGTFTSIRSERFLNEVRGHVLALHRLARGQVRGRGHRPHCLFDQRLLRPGHLGRPAGGDLRGRRYRRRSGSARTPSRPAGRSPTTSPSSCSRRSRTASTASPARPASLPTRSSTTRTSRWCPRRG